MKKRFLGALALLLILLSLFACREEADEGYKIKVLLAYPEQSLLNDPPYVYVSSGEDVSFPLSMAPGYQYLGNDCEAEYRDGVLTLKNVKYPTTISLDIAAHSTLDDPNKGDGTTPGTVESLKYSYKAQTGGSIISTKEAGMLDAGTSITVTATPKEGYTFYGWSVGNVLTSQGTLVSEEAEYTFTLNEATSLHANFKGEKQAILCYHLGDGTTSTGADIYYASYPLDYYYYPNTVPDMGTFRRDGYSLLEYSEKEDGSGFVTCPGGKVFLDTSEVIHLWAQWAKWSRADLFEGTVSGSNYQITQYLGNESRVVIPGTIDGKKVTVIKAGAFESCSMNTVVFHRDLQTIESKAFQYCPKLDTVYLSDSIQKIYDDTFFQCPAFKNLRYRAATAPIYSTGMGAYIRKLERVVYYYGKANTLTVVSGSSSLYGLDSPLMEELLAKEGYDYVVCNLGMHANVSQLFYLDFISDFMDEGDLVIQAPEIYPLTLNATVDKQMLCLLESGCNLFRYLDISRYDGLFSAIQKVNAEKAKTTKKRQYTDSRTDLNIQGDRLPSTKSQYKTFSSTPITVSGRTLSDSTIQNFNDMYEIFHARGVTVYYSFAPLNIETFQSTDDEVAAFHKLIDERLLPTRISDFKTFLMERKHIFNSDWHTNDIGAVIRTERLCADILAQLKKNKT